MDGRFPWIGRLEFLAEFVDELLRADAAAQSGGLEFLGITEAEKGAEGEEEEERDDFIAVVAVSSFKELWGPKMELEFRWIGEWCTTIAWNEEIKHFLIEKT